MRLKLIFKHWHKISPKKKLQIFGILGALFISIGILAATHRLNIFAETTQISNTATIFYDEGGQTKSVQSNTVITALSATTSTINVALSLQGRTSYSITGALLTINTTGGSQVAQPTISTDATGKGQTSLDLASGNYDFKIKVPGYLTNTLKNLALANPLSLNFGTLKGGDLNNDGIVNSIDFSVLNGKWLQNDPTADINKDGVVNSIDFSVMNGNWLASDI